MKQRILIVDDSASMRQLVGFTLNDAGYEVVAASSAEEALAIAGTQGAELVITDLNMPGLSGIELIRKLRLLPSYRFTPIIMLTTESKEAVKEEGMKAGASGWIVKPFSPEVLVGLAAKHIRA